MSAVETGPAGDVTVDELFRDLSATDAVAISPGTDVVAATCPAHGMESPGKL
ncbi:hypothetical protein [Frankia sp. R82]|uniref:hypothetical protein n=1 Tax=Frankia sp. R82 TaxID=2950553 RepID=UPI0020443C0F|nr:hypothetical protein [Frankia sp. R82]MCM3887256.1 hypothetical protein [Frankia sp. R82]